MESPARRRRRNRPHGTIAVSCPECPFFDVCGGLDTDYPLLNCFDLYCRGGTDCHCVCPCKPLEFEERLQEIQGLCSDNLDGIDQQPLDLPLYIPVIHHASKRVRPLNCHTVALDTYSCLALRNGNHRTVVQDPDELREKFGLRSDSQVVLRGVAKDADLERYWEHRCRDETPRQLASLDVLAAVGPNFSHFLEVPRTDTLFNRKRQLICLEELHAAGIPPIPHLNATMPGDWRFWRDYLLMSKTVCIVAAEFQTGNRNREQGRKVISELSNIQEHIGRDLHPLIIGGGQFVDFVAERFDRFTLMDSQPFMKTMRRQRFEPKDGHRHWRDSFTLIGQPLDDLLQRNVDDYCDWVESRLGAPRVASPPLTILKCPPSPELAPDRCAPRTACESQEPSVGIVRVASSDPSGADTNE